MLRVAHRQCLPSQIQSPWWHDVHLPSRIVCPLSLCPCFFVGLLSHHFLAKKLQIVMCKQYTKSTLFNNFESSFPQNAKMYYYQSKCWKDTKLSLSTLFQYSYYYYEILLLHLHKEFKQKIHLCWYSKFQYIPPIPLPHAPLFFPLFLILRRGRPGEVDLGWGYACLYYLGEKTKKNT